MLFCFCNILKPFSLRSLLTFKSSEHAFCVIYIYCHKREFKSAVGGGIEPQSLIVSKTSMPSQSPESKSKRQASNPPVHQLEKTTSRGLTPKTLH